MTHQELRERSHNPQKFFGIKQMLLPDYTMGRDYALMAVLCAGMFAVPALLMRAVCGGARACRTSGEARA